jgi:hypothetical protein
MRVVASLLCVTLLAACFPENPKARTIAKISEGGAVLAGIAILAVANSGADCDAHGQPGVPDSNCQSSSGTASTIGLSMIVVGLLGFIATVSTTPVDKKPVATDIVPAPVLSPQPPAMQIPPAQPQPPPDTTTKAPPAGAPAS